MTGPAFPATAICICGLAAEARVARAAGLQALVGAGDRQRTAALAEGVVQEAGLLVSFGIAGALAPGLRAGDVVVSGDIVSKAGGWCVDERFAARWALLAKEIGAVAGRVLGACRIIAAAGEKRRARDATGALAVDLESDVVARIASAAGIPFVAVRAIADTADEDLPPAALIPLGADGTPRLGRVLGSVLWRPRQAPALVRLARETRTALAALRLPARALHGLVAAA